jgi:uncharacterized coiled-coil DUF342 family protein
MLMLDQVFHRGREAAMSDAEKRSAMGAEVSRLRSVPRETAASVQKAARVIDLVRAAAAEPRAADGRNICALEDEIGRVREAIAAMKRSLREQESHRGRAKGGETRIEQRFRAEGKQP